MPEDPTSAPLGYEFGPFRLNAKERVLSRNGETVPLTPKAFDVLLTIGDEAREACVGVECRIPPPVELRPLDIF